MTPQEVRRWVLGWVGLVVLVGGLTVATNLTPGHPWAASPTPEGWMAAAWLTAGSGAGMALAAMLLRK